MLKSIDTFATFKTQLKISLAYFFHIFIGLMILSVIIFVYFLSICPIQDKQYAAIEKLTYSAQYPKTQLLATQALAQPELTQWQYFKILRAYQYEKNLIQKYPALDLSDAPLRF